MGTALALLTSSKALAIGGLAAKIGGGIFAGMSASKAAEQEASDLEFQAQLQREEADEEAQRLDKQNKKFLARQSLMFGKGGVTLSGSPLLILQETKEESDKESASVRKRGKALFKFGMGKAERTRSAGRSAFIGSIFSGISTGGLGAYEIFKS